MDKVARMVTLEDVTLSKSQFPMLPDNGVRVHERVAEADGKPPPQRTIALDRLEASLAASGTATPAGVPVNTTPTADPRQLRAGAPRAY